MFFKFKNQAYYSKYKSLKNIEQHKNMNFSELLVYIAFLSKIFIECMCHVHLKTILWIKNA